MSNRSSLVVLAVALAAWPAFAQQCADCHDEVAAGMTHQIHMRIQSFEVGGRSVGCVGCHGDGAAHMAEGDASLIRTFADWTAADVRVCTDCHAQLSGARMAEWQASTHAMEGVYCNACHAVHGENKPLESCVGCHTEVYAQFELPTHHPVREGKMTCVSCHDPHRATEAQLDTDFRLNDLCYQCHQSKEGPFIFEHEPVVEDCSLCHMAHGSVADNLLTANEPMLCLQCHEIHFHAGLVSPDGAVDVGGTERDNPSGRFSMNRAFTTNCSQCHSQIHGTDLPAQTLAGQGRGLVR